MTTLREVDFDPFADSPVGEALPFDRNAALAETDKDLGLPAGFSAAQIQVESGGNPKARSSAGAMGLAQVMPGTLAVISKRLGRELDPDDEKDAVDIHREVMRENLAKFKDPAKALMAYNGGWNPDKWDNHETAAYVGKVKAAMKSGQNPIMAAAEKVANAVIPSAQAAQATKEATLHEVDFDPFAQGAAPKRSMIDELGRQLGLTVRAGVSGVASIPAMASDAITGPINAGLDAVAGRGNGFRFQPAGRALNNVMTNAGVPVPENARERVVQDAASAVAGAGGMVKGGLGLAKYASGPVARGVGETLAAGPGLQGISAATGAGASSTVRENGGGEGAQVAAGLAGALAPGFAVPAGAATVRGALRGGEAGRQRVADNIATFERASGTTPTLGQATEGRAQRAAESILSKFPGGAGVMARKAQGQLDDMAASVQKLSDELAPGASAVNAGEAIAKSARTFKEGFKIHQNRLYNTLDKHIPEDTPIQVGNTEFALKELNAGIEGAPNISEFFKNAKIKGIDKALQADLELSATGGALPYEAVKKLRTLIGNEIADNSLVADVPRSKWSALYGALSEDLGVAAKQAGPEAEQSWQWANQYTKTQLARLEQVSDIVARDTPEKIFMGAISGTAEGDTIVKRVISMIPKSQRREVAAAVLQRMGRATNGQQNAMGDAFSSETFLTNLSKLSAPARATLFGRTGNAELETKVLSMAKMADNLRQGSKVFANPSGTAQAVTLKEALLGAGAAAATGNGGTAAGIVGGIGGANVAARLVTNPNLVKKLAQTTALNDGARASLAGAAARVNDVTPPSETYLHEVGFDPFAQAAPSADTAQQPAPQPLSFEEAQFADPASPDAGPPAYIELNGMAQPDGYQPESSPAWGAEVNSVDQPDFAPIPAPQPQPEPEPKIEPIAAIGAAKTIDEAIAAAGIALNSYPSAQDLARAMPVPAPVQAEPEPVAVSMALPSVDGVASQEPQTTWYGRRGDGYGALGDAQLALQSRRKAAPQMDWRVETMPNNRYRLAGYQQAQHEEAMADVQGGANAGASASFEAMPRSDGTLAIRGDAQALMQTLIAAGIPTQGMMRMNGGVLVGRSQAGRVREAIDRMTAAPEPWSDSAMLGATDGLQGRQV